MRRSRTGLPCALISTTSSPVKERGAAKKVTIDAVEHAPARTVAARLDDLGQRRVPRAKVLDAARQMPRDGMRVRTRQADDADAAASRGRRNGGDGVGCGEHATGARLAQRVGRDDDGLQKRVADALGRRGGILGHGHVDDAARVGIEWTDLLRRPARPGLVDQELRHLSQFRILALAETQRVDHVVPVAARVAAERGVHDHLERVERLAFAAQQRVSALTGEVHPDVVRGLLDIDRKREPHGAEHLLDERPDLSIEIAAHERPYDFPPPPLPGALTLAAAGRTGGAAGAPMMRLVRSCWPIASRLLTNQ